MSNLCPQCGAPVDAGATKCEYCGAAIAQTPEQSAERSNWPIKNEVDAALLAVLLGGIGVHKFYLGQTFKGVLSIIFCWTYIPSILGLIEGIMILCSNDENFQIKYKCRIG